MRRAFELGSVSHAAYDVPKKYDGGLGQVFLVDSQHRLAGEGEGGV